jgi:hypothetical protein
MASSLYNLAGMKPIMSEMAADATVENELDAHVEDTVALSLEPSTEDTVDLDESANIDLVTDIEDGLNDEFVAISNEKLVATEIKHTAAVAKSAPAAQTTSKKGKKRK